MFEQNITPRKQPRLRFPAIFAGSVVVHVVLLGLLFSVFVYRTAGKFALFSFEDGAEDANRYKVAMVDTSKPLVLPPGFYAVKTVKPLDEVRNAERKEKARPNEDRKTKKEEPGKADGDGTRADAAEVPEQEETAKFGSIRANALRPHLRAVYAAYEEGRIPDRPFRVSVTCKVQPDGSLTDIRIVASSGNGMIDQTALNLFREIGAMQALKPLATLSSLSLTLERGAATSSLSAVGFSGTEAQAEDLTNMLTMGASLAPYTVKNEDQRALLRQLHITRSGNRIGASIDLPNSRAGEMMKRSFGSQPDATPPPSKPTA
jgi:TonB family protein